MRSRPHDGTQRATDDSFVVLDPKDPHAAVSIPPGFLEAHSNRSWLIFEHCS